MPNLGNTTRPAYVYDAETDTWLPIGVGAHSHDYTSQFIGKTLVDAKGDIVTASANDVPAILSKGADGTVLVADSTTSTGLAWQPYAAPFTAGKNKIINGDFGIWQRGTTFTNPAGDTYTADRFMIDYGTAAPTSNSVTRQTFTPGTAPVAGYEGVFFFRSTLTTVGTTSRLSIHHKIENVQTYAGQTVTLSFFAKADSARTLAGFIQQNFGSGGSTTVSTAITSQSITTAWTRFSMQIAVPSISGKTIGTSSFLNIRLDQAVAAGSVLELWGLQLEAGPVATPFQTATGTIQGELAACQRYYQKIGTDGNPYQLFTTCAVESSVTAWGAVYLPVKMRSTPSGSFTSAAGWTLQGMTISNANMYFDANQTGPSIVTIGTTSGSGMTAFQSRYLRAANDLTTALNLNAEL